MGGDDDSWGWLLATWADAEELKLVGHGSEPMSFLDASFQLLGEAVVEFDDLGALGADEVMVMAAVGIIYQFETRDTVAEVETLHHVHLLEQVHGSVDRREVAVTFGEHAKNFFDRGRVTILPHRIQDALAWACDFSSLGS